MIIRSRGKLDDELGSSLLLGVVERSEPADDFDGIFFGFCSLGIFVLLISHA